MISSLWAFPAVMRLQARPWDGLAEDLVRNPETPVILGKVAGRVATQK